MTALRLLKLALTCFPALWFASVSAETTDSTHRYTGEAPGATEDFRMNGPWTLSWVAASEFPQLAFMQMQLVDASTNRFLGLVAQRDGTGHGERLIREPGTYRVVVTGRNVDWTIQVEPVTGDLAKLVTSRPDVESITLVQPETGVSPELVKNASGWHADGEKAILLTTGDGDTVRITFHGDVACHGLPDSHNLFFVTAGFDTDVYNAVMLENGTRCYLAAPVSASQLGGSRNP